MRWSLNPKGTFGAAVFLIMSATLMLQIVVTRVLSVINWYYLAFFVIGIAMFGLSAGGVWVYFRKERFKPANLASYLSYYSILFSLSIFVSVMSLTFLMPSIEFVQVMSGDHSWFYTTIVWALGTMCLGLPFIYSGIVASLALTRSKYSTSYVYACDLVGAATGCLLVLAILTWVDGISAMLLTAIIGLLSASIFSSQREKEDPDEVTGLRPLLIKNYKPILFFTLAFVLFNVASGGAVRPWASKGNVELAERTPDFIAWNSFSRITATKKAVSPAKLWGPSRRYNPEDWQIEQRLHVIDGDAGTFAHNLPGGLKDAGFLDFDLTNLAYQREGIKNSAVIGIGAGRDLLAAKYFGVERVTGVEINGILVDLLFGENEFSKFAGIKRLDGINVVNDEARNWFARTDATFDLIQMSLIDTWAATGAGAFTLSENALYTVEGWITFMNRLNDGGVFTVSRWFDPRSPHEAGRLLSLAMATGFELGYENPSQHILLANSDKIATLIFSQHPITTEARAGYYEWLAERDFDVLASEGVEGLEGIMSQIFSSASREELERAVEGFAFDLSPPTDNRPFFFNQLPFRTALRLMLEDKPSDDSLVIGGNLLATTTLISLLFVALFFISTCLIWPLKRGLKESNIVVVASGSAFFCLIGLGFMFVEIGLLQRFSVFLGHPTYALGIVLFSLILATGLGSAISSRWRLDTVPRFVLWTLGTSGYLLLSATYLGELLNLLQAVQLGQRFLITVALIFPIGLLMGFAFPTGMNIISQIDNRPTPWFWGLNGAAGVLASILALTTAMTFGINAVLGFGAICYILLIPSMMALLKHQEATALGRKTSLIADAIVEE